MGTYLNPGNKGFKRIVNGEYVDKTGLISLINSTIGTTKNLICISRPRRFGKSYAAQMLCAYYDRSCDSRDLFANLEIAEKSDYGDYLNKYDVIYLDMTNLLGKVKPEKLVSYIEQRILTDIKKDYPGIQADGSFDEVLIHTVEHTGSPFIMIIDEWDAPIRETPEIESEYLKFLRMLFKGSGTTSRIFAAAYMTGILPIKKDGSQSAISDFEEYSMLDPRCFADYVGFTENEVRTLCEKKKRNFQSIKKWYDGYSVGVQHSVYNPYSVMQAVDSGKYRSYWKKTSAAETLMAYIDMDIDGLQEEIARLIAGESVTVNTDFFQNDVETFADKDDVLTLLIHLGYLTYEEVWDSYSAEQDEELTGLARIPNEEIRTEFRQILRKAKHRSLLALVQKSDQLLADTIAGDTASVAKAIQEVHDSEYAPTFYNNEQSLRYVVKLAYLSCIDQYAKVEELPSGHGVADVVFIPKRRSPLPALIVELKWNKSPEGAIRQIKENGYQDVLKNYGGEVILVGINYDEKSKVHECRIESAGSRL